MLAATPPMGWNTWNTFGHEIDERIVLENADAMAVSGLRAAGYRYIVVDDCWACRERDPETGKIVPDPEKFPHGMKYVSDYVHSKGLKFGMYSCAGTRTCGDYPGSFDYEFLDAATFAEYGCDFLKYDCCNIPAGVSESLLYRRMGLALRASGREIVFSTANCGHENVQAWARAAGAHMYRCTGDIVDSFWSMKNIALSQKDRLAGTAPGCFNDTDMLTVGMYGRGLVGTTGCTTPEYRTQFSLWCLYSAPLMLGCDLRALSPEMLDLVTNKNLLRINQDEEVRPPMVCRAAPDGDEYVFFKHLSGGEFALGFFNMDDGDAVTEARLADFGLSETAGAALSLTDAMTDEPAGTAGETLSVRVPAHDCRVFLARLTER